MNPGITGNQNWGSLNRKAKPELILKILPEFKPEVIPEVKPEVIYGVQLICSMLVDLKSQKEITISFWTKRQIDTESCICNRLPPIAVHISFWMHTTG